MDNPLTLQEAKDQVAKKYGYNSFIEFSSRKVKLHSYNAFWEVTNEAAELHAYNKSEAAQLLLEEVIKYDYDHLRKHGVSALTAVLSDKIKNFLNNG